MYMHQLPNGNIIMHEGLPRELAIQRMEDHQRWCQEHREELAVSSQQLFDDMFAVSYTHLTLPTILRV